MVSLTNGAKTAAQHLVWAWRNGIIEQQFGLIEMPSDEKRNEWVFVPGAGIVDEEAFQIPTHMNFRELEHARLITITKSRKGNWSIFMLQDLQDFVDADIEASSNDAHLSTAPTKIFLSHSSKDEDLAPLIAEQIEHELQNEVKVFASTWKSPIPSGAFWRDTVLTNLEASEVLVILLTDQAANSMWVGFEYGYFWKKFDGKQIHVLYYPDINIPSPLNDLQGKRVTEYGEIADTFKALRDHFDQPYEEPYEARANISAIVGLANAEAQVPSAAEDKQRFEAQLENVESVAIRHNKEAWIGIQSKGFWEVIIRPVVFVKELIPTLADCKSLMVGSQVRLRGWPYPYVELQDMTAGQDWIEASYKGMNGVEYWRLFQSGQFIHSFGSHEDYESDAGRVMDTPYLTVLSTIITFTEIFEFAANLAANGILDQGVEIQVNLRQMRNRVLFDPHISTLGRTAGIAICRLQDIPIDRATSKNQLLYERHDMALEASIRVFERFNWDNPPWETLKKRQDDLLRKSG